MKKTTSQETSPDVSACPTVKELHAVLTHLTTQDAHMDSKLRMLLLKKPSTPRHTSRSGQHVIKHNALPCGNHRAASLLCREALGYLVIPR